MLAITAELQAERDEASSHLAEARAELSGVQREWEALKRDREARERPPEGRRPEVPSAPVDGDGEPRRQKSRGLMMEPVGKNGWMQVSQSTF